MPIWRVTKRQCREVHDRLDFVGVVSIARDNAVYSNSFLSSELSYCDRHVCNYIRVFTGGCAERLKQLNRPSRARVIKEGREVLLNQTGIFTNHGKTYVVLSGGIVRANRGLSNLGGSAEPVMPSAPLQVGQL
jgi:hypothetical protein